jgi:hypothetical protein
MEVRMRRWLIIGMMACSCDVTLAHDLWISREQRKNAAGEWCCGERDCALLDGAAVEWRTNPNGYEVHGNGEIEFEYGWYPTNTMSKIERYDEFVPERETLPSADGKYWICKPKNGPRRCFFAPPPNS